LLQNAPGPSTYRDRRQAQDLTVDSLSHLIDEGSELYFAHREDGNYFSPDLEKTFESATASPTSPPPKVASPSQSATTLSASHSRRRTSSAADTLSDSPTAARSSRRPGLVQYGSWLSARGSRIFTVDEDFYRPTSPPRSFQIRASQSSPKLERHASSASQRTQRMPVTPPSQQGIVLFDSNLPLRSSAASPQPMSQVSAMQSIPRQEGYPSSPSQHTQQMPTEQSRSTRSLRSPPGLSRSHSSPTRPGAMLPEASASQQLPTPNVFVPSARSRPGTSRSNPSVGQPVLLPSPPLPGEPRSAPPPPPAFPRPMSVALERSLPPLPTSSASLTSRLRRKASEALLQTRSSLDAIRPYNLRSSSARGSSDASRMSEELPSQASLSSFSPRRVRSPVVRMPLDPLPEDVAAARVNLAEDQVDTSESDQPSPMLTRAARHMPRSNQADPPATTSLASPEPRWEGFMYSRRSRHSHFRNDWQRRYFRLRGTSLAVYASDRASDGQTLKIYHIASLVTGVAPATMTSLRRLVSTHLTPQPADAPYAFEFTSPDGSIRTFAVPTAPERQKWMRQMEAGWRAVEARRAELDAIDLERVRSRMEAEEVARRGLREEERQARVKGKGRAPPEFI
jgi:hypothetical protein